jgi:bifunctional non-homologous end joining protein LigD
VSGPAGSRDGTRRVTVARVRGSPGGMPDLVPPMQAGTGDLPTGDGWAVEFAWEGLRCVGYVRPGEVRLRTASDRDVTSAFPELEVLGVRSPRRGMVLDGTVVALDEGGQPSRRPLRRRTAARHPSASLLRRTPVGLLVTDLVWLNGRSTTELPYQERRALLADLDLAGHPVVVPPSFPAADAEHVMATAERFGLDGLHAKRLDGRYRPGRRSRSWLRVPLRRVRQVLVGGWSPADRSRGTVGALLLGVPTGTGLRYVGRVGLRSVEDLDALADALPALHQDRSPFTTPVPAAVARDAGWLAPRIAGRVEFQEWTGDGRLRLPVWRGLVPPAEYGATRWAVPDGPHADDPGAGGAAVGAAGGTHGTGSPAAGPPEAGVETPDAHLAADEGGRGAAGGRTAAAAGAAAPEPGPPDHGLPPGPHPSARRLEQHFVYNALNTIAALVRTDPARARELLLGFADLNRAADEAAAAQASTLGREMAAVRAYLDLEQARFGRRLRAEVDVGQDLHHVTVTPLQVLSEVRTIVQQRIEPRPGGGTLRITARAVDGGCEVSVADHGAEPDPVTGGLGGGVPVVVRLPPDRPVRT